MDPLSVVALLLASVATLTAFYVRKGILTEIEAVGAVVRRPYDDTAVRADVDQNQDRIAGLQADIQELADRLRDQNLAIAEGIERVDRAERRVRAAVKRARERMAEIGYEDPGLEAEAELLRLSNETGGGAEGVQQVQLPLESAPARDMSAFPGDW